MSWSLMFTQCWALTGVRHVSKEIFASTIADSYHGCVRRHLDTISGLPMGFIGEDKRNLLYEEILKICDENSNSVGDKNFLQQMGPIITKYWEDMIIDGPYGSVVIMFPGIWIAPPIKQNLNFSIMAAMFVLVSKIHLMTIVGVFTSLLKGPNGEPLIIAPWAGASLQTFP